MDGVDSSSLLCQCGSERSGEDACLSVWCSEGGGLCLPTCLVQGGEGLLACMVQGTEDIHREEFAAREVRVGLWSLEVWPLWCAALGC